jgi:hypothetical protein
LNPCRPICGTAWNCGFASAPSACADKPRHRRDNGAVGKHGAGEYALVDAQMIPEQALEHGAQIGGRFQVAPLVKLGSLQSRPVSDHAAALNPTFPTGPSILEFCRQKLNRFKGR